MIRRGGKPCKKCGGFNEDTNPNGTIDCVDCGNFKAKIPEGTSQNEDMEKSIEQHGIRVHNELKAILKRNKEKYGQKKKKS